MGAQRSSIRSRLAGRGDGGRHALCLFVCLCLSTVVCVAAPPVRVGLHDAEPVAFRDASGVARGFLIDVLEHVAAEEDWELEYVYGSWSECEERLRRGEIDLLFPILPSPQRRRVFDFTEQSMFATWGRVFARGDVQIESVLDLEGKVVAGVRGDVFQRELRELVSSFELNCTFLEYDTMTQVLEALASGRADAAPIEDKAGYWDTMEYDLEATPVVFKPGASHVAAPKGRRADLLAALDRHLIALKSNPTSPYYAAYDSWFRPQSRRWPRWLIIIAGVTGALALLFGGFNAVLRARVRAGTRELRLRNEQLEQEIGDRQRAEQESRRLEEQLRHSQKMEAMGTLAAGVAHDFHNLLMVISAHAGRLRERVREDRETQESLRVVDDAVRQGTGFTRSLLTFSRKLPTHKSPVDVRAALETASRMLQRTLPANVDLVLEADDDCRPWISAPEHQLQQIVINLAVNARDAMPDGGTIRISLSSAAGREGDGADRDPGVARIAISDTGIGMSADVQQRIFEPFFSTKSRGEGTGLGLAFVHGVVEDCGGRISVRSGPGAGASFLIELPLIALRPEVGLEPGAIQPRRGGGELILLAEDRQQIREVLAAFLDSQGYEVRQVSDGRSLLECFAQNRHEVRLLVLDVDLPERSGLEALRSIREQGFDTPAIVMSGSVEADADPDLRDAILLTKPFELIELGQLAHGLLSASTTTDRA